MTAWQVREWSGIRLEPSRVVFTGEPADAARDYGRRRATLRRGFVMLCDDSGAAVEMRAVPHNPN